MKETNKEKILVASPLPPPYSGYEKITEYILKSKISQEFDIIHLDTSNKRTNIVRGKFSVLNIFNTGKLIIKIIWLLLIHRPKMANIPIARNKAGFLKWSALIVVASIFKVKVVSRLGGDDFDKFYHASSCLMKKYIKSVLHRISIIIVRANRLKKQFSGLVSEDKLRVVYLPIDISEFSNTTVNKKDPDGVTKILYMGHISKAKGALDLLEAIPILIKDARNIEFSFVGDIMKAERNIVHINNPHDIEEKINSIIKENELSQYVKFFGILKGREKIRMLQKSDIFVFPSYSEGFPFAVLEAMAAGLPIVSTPVGALPEVFEDRINVLFTEIGNPQKIADNIATLIKDKHLADSMCKINKDLIKREFNLDIFGGRMISIFNGLKKGTVSSR